MASCHWKGTCRGTLEKTFWDCRFGYQGRQYVILNDCGCGCDPLSYQQSWISGPMEYGRLE